MLLRSTALAGLRPEPLRVSAIRRPSTFAVRGMSDLICPSTEDGRHKKVVWQDAKAGRSGFSCVRCHKTWEWQNLSPDHVACVPTWEIYPGGAA